MFYCSLKLGRAAGNHSPQSYRSQALGSPLSSLHLLLHTLWDTCMKTGTNLLSSNSSLTCGTTLYCFGLPAHTVGPLLSTKISYFHVSAICIAGWFWVVTVFVIFLQAQVTCKIQKTLVSLFNALLDRMDTCNNVTRVTDDLVPQLSGLKIIWIHLHML